MKITIGTSHKLSARQMKEICRILGVRLNEAQRQRLVSIAEASEEATAYLPVRQKVHRFRRWLLGKEEIVDIFFDMKNS